MDFKKIVLAGLVAGMACSGACAMNSGNKECQIQGRLEVSGDLNKLSFVNTDGKRDFTPNEWRKNDFLKKIGGALQEDAQKLTWTKEQETENINDFVTKAHEFEVTYRDALSNKLETEKLQLNKSRYLCVQKRGRTGSRVGLVCALGLGGLAAAGFKRRLFGAGGLISLAVSAGGYAVARLAQSQVKNAEERLRALEAKPKGLLVDYAAKELAFKMSMDKLILHYVSYIGKVLYLIHDNHNCGALEKDIKASLRKKCPDGYMLNIDDSYVSNSEVFNRFGYGAKSNEEKDFSTFHCVQNKDNQLLLRYAGLSVVNALTKLDKELLWSRGKEFKESLSDEQEKGEFFKDRQDNYCKLTPCNFNYKLTQKEHQNVQEILKERELNKLMDV